MSAEPSVSAAGGCGATAERGVAHELLWHLAVDGRIFLSRCYLNRADQQKIKGMQYQLTQAQNILHHHPRRRFSFCTVPAVSHPFDIEMTKRAYEELKVANREALTVLRGDNGDNRESPYAMNARSSDMQSVFGNLLQTVLSTRNNNSSLKLFKVPYPILIVLVDFTDENFEWDEEIHRDLVFGEGITVEKFWDQNFHGTVDFIATPIPGATDGIITVEFDGPHPNLTDNSEMSLWIAEHLGAYIADYIDPVALDADFNGWLTREELSVHFVLSGSHEKGGGFATPFNISAYGRALTLSGIKVHGFAVAAEQG